VWCACRQPALCPAHVAWFSQRSSSRRTRRAEEEENKLAVKQRGAGQAGMGFGRGSGICRIGWEHKAWPVGSGRWLGSVWVCALPAAILHSNLQLYGMGRAAKREPRGGRYAAICKGPQGASGGLNSPTVNPAEGQTNSEKVCVVLELPACWHIRKDGRRECRKKRVMEGANQAKERRLFV